MIKENGYKIEGGEMKFKIIDNNGNEVCTEYNGRMQTLDDRNGVESIFDYLNNNGRNKPYTIKFDVFDNNIEKIEMYAYKNPVYSREEILYLLKTSFPNKSISSILGDFNVSASREIHLFEQKLRELGKINAEKIMKL